MVTESGTRTGGQPEARRAVRHAWQEAGDGTGAMEQGPCGTGAGGGATEAATHAHPIPDIDIFFSWR